MASIFQENDKFQAFQAPLKKCFFLMLIFLISDILDSSKVQEV